MIRQTHTDAAAANPQLAALLDSTLTRLQSARATHLGYPYNLDFAPAVPSGFSGLLVNNLGDPWVGSHYGTEVCAIERDVIGWLSRLWGGQGDMRGNVGASGTEGNLWGIFLGREAFPDATLIHSADAHYSVPKAARIMRISAVEVASDHTGAIDLIDLERVALQTRGPVILVLTCGTTMTGAHDDIAGALDVLDRAGIGPDRRYVHLDGALNAMVIPFLPETAPGIRPDFGLGIDSISTSGHKMIGTPMPCGVLVCRKVHSDRIARAIAYLRSDDTTLMGSRNGHGVLAIWSRLMGHGAGRYAADARRCVHAAQGLASRLRAGGVAALCNPHGMTVVFPEPSADVVGRYQLACHKGRAHAVIMPSVTPALIDAFAQDYLGWFDLSRRPMAEMMAV